MIPTAMRFKSQFAPLFFFTILSMFAQQSRTTSPSTMELCSVKLSIGMPKETVIAKLAEACSVTKITDLDTDKWLLSDKSARPNPVAIVEFESGRLSSASRTCLPSGGSSEYGAEGLARSLILAVNSLTNGRDSDVIIRTKVKQDKDYNFYTLIIYLANDRQINVTLMANAANGKTLLLDVDEAISK